MALIILGRIVSLIIQNETFKKSKYSEASGNSFMNTRFNTGNYGEYLIFAKLEILPGHNRLLANVYVPKEDGTTSEIDVIMIAQNGIFVFESKNYSGWIFGDEKQSMWTQTLEGGLKNKFYNPVRQNKAHINALSKYLGGIEANIFRSYVIFSERCELKNVNVNSPNLALIQRHYLLDRIKHDLIYFDFCFSQTQVEEIYNKLR